MNYRPVALLLLCALGSISPIVPRGAIAAPAPAADRETVAIALAEAEAARRRAAEVRAEWLGTGALIEQARAAARDEDWQSALELAKRAQRQGQLALEQAQREARAWHDRVIR